MLDSGSIPASPPANVEIYTRQYCGFCVRAKMFLDQNGIAYTEIKIDGDNDLRRAMIERANGRMTVPQIFINDQGIGGCDELLMLDRQGELAALLAGE